jgi:hypothetical protein
MADSLLTRPGTSTSATDSRSTLVEDMTTRDIPNGPSLAQSIASSSREQWAWLDALARALDCAALLVDAQGTPGPVVGASTGVETIRALLARSEPSLLSALGQALESDRAHRTNVGTLNIVCRRLRVQGTTVGALVISAHARPSSTSQGAGSTDIETLEPWLTGAVEAHLGQRLPDEGEEAFDRISSLHRLLHDGVEGGNEREVVTAFAEALFAWDGIEAIGYVEDVQGQWARAMSPPGTTLPAVLEAEFGQRLRGRQTARLGAQDIARLGFAAGRHVVALHISETTPAPWLLLFAEGYRALNVPRLNLYADLLREALARLSSIVETRAAWAILQTLVGATEQIETAVDAALREFSRVVDGVAVSLIVTNATGTTLLVAGDRESIAAVRPFDRGHRLVSTAHLADLGTMQMTVRRARGQSFTRREQHLVDRAAAIFSAWLPGAMKQRVGNASTASATRAFEDVLERAAAQMVRDGLDVSAVVMIVPESESSVALLQSWVTEIRARLRGSDLAGAISDREIGVLLSGTSQTDVPVVCRRLGRSLGLEENALTTALGVATITAGSNADEPIVSAARKNLPGRGSAPLSKRVSQ